MTDGWITAAGAVIDVQIRVGPRRAKLLERNGLQIPEPVCLRAQLDILFAVESEL